MSGMDDPIEFGKHEQKRTMYARLVGGCLGAKARALKFDPDPTKFQYAAATFMDQSKAADERLANCTTEREMLLVCKPFVTELAETLRNIEEAEEAD